LAEVFRPLKFPSCRFPLSKVPFDIRISTFGIYLPKAGLLRNNRGGSMEVAGCTGEICPDRVARRDTMWILAGKWVSNRLRERMV
jgi:hypothetical protein